MRGAQHRDTLNKVLLALLTANLVYGGITILRLAVNNGGRRCRAHATAARARARANASVRAIACCRERRQAKPSNDQLLAKLEKAQKEHHSGGSRGEQQ
jgi:hypothetical protein